MIQPFTEGPPLYTYACLTIVMVLFISTFQSKPTMVPKSMNIIIRVQLRVIRVVASQNEPLLQVFGEAFQTIVSGGQNSLGGI